MSKGRDFTSLNHTLHYALFGALFGCCFPVFSTLIDAYVQGVGYSLESLLDVQRRQPLHWVIDTAPFFLGLFASLAGRRQDAIALFNVSLEKEVEVRRRAEREMAEAKEAAEAARGVAEVANRAKSAFLANMSHELRTPLNAIIGYSEILLEDAKDMGYGEATADLNRIQNAGRHLLEIISDILDLSKIEAGKMDLHFEELDLGSLLKGVLETAAPLAEKNANKLEFDCEKEVGTLYTDQTKIRQILLNLLSNACKFTQNGRVHLRVWRERERGGEELVCTVADSGIGMTEQEVERLFQPFTQADASTTRKYGGTGLVLAISKRFCQLMGCDISVESAPGVGSVLRCVCRCTIGATPRSRAPLVPRANKVVAATRCWPSTTMRQRATWCGVLWSAKATACIRPLVGRRGWIWLARSNQTPSRLMYSCQRWTGGRYWRS